MIRDNKTRYHLLIGFLFILITLVTILSNGTNKPASAMETLYPNQIVWQNSADPIANCRYGVTTSNFENQLEWVTNLGAGWFVDFSFESAEPSNGAEHAAVIYVHQNKDAYGNYLPSYTILPELTEGSLAPVIHRNPGNIWFVGNEVDRGPNPGETVSVGGDTYPDVYAKIYHETYNFIKSQDPTALVANSAFVEVTPNRLQYLDMVWNSYRARYRTDMPVDVWNMHLYVLPELTFDGQPNNVANIAVGTNSQLGIRQSDNTPNLCGLDEIYCYAEHDDMNAFASQVFAMRKWMKDHGQQDKPLIISEYSILWPYYHNGQACGFKDEYGNCFDPPRVANYLANSFNYLLNQAIDPNLGYALDGNRLVQQWLWFGVYYNGLGHTSNLITSDDPPALTNVGLEFQTIAMNDPVTINLLPGTVEDIFRGVNSTDTVDVELKVPIYNNGNHRLRSDFEVTFYSDENLSETIGTAIIEAPTEDWLGLQGCAVHHVDASVVWSDLPLGIHQFWAKIDPLGQIGETNESDNITSGMVFVVPARAFLPLIQSK